MENASQKKKLFCVILRNVAAMNQLLDEMDRIGFVMDFGIGGKWSGLMDQMVADLNEAMEMEYQSAVDYFFETRLNGHECRILAGGKEYLLETPEQLWDYLAQTGQISDEVKA
ncbi:MAG: hypothetical protein IKZ33_01725 [Lentisphaeria bacterium]|nr:hypothetical protein [Lentisphaeria bacterium]